MKSKIYFDSSGHYIGTEREIEKKKLQFWRKAKQIKGEGRKRHQKNEIGSC